MAVNWTDIAANLPGYGPFGAINRAWAAIREHPDQAGQLAALALLWPSLSPAEHASIAGAVAEAVEAGRLMAEPGGTEPIDAEIIPIVPGSAHGGTQGRRYRIQGGLQRRDPITGDVETVGGFSVELPTIPTFDDLNRILREAAESEREADPGRGRRDTLPGSLSPDAVEDIDEIEAYGLMVLAEY